MTREILSFVESERRGAAAVVMVDAAGAVHELRPRDIDYCFADFIVRLVGGERNQADPLWQGAFIVSLFVARGQVRFDISAFAGGMIRFTAGREVPLPGLDAWRAALVASGVVGSPRALDYPLILDNDCLYLHRFRRAEAEVAAFAGARLRQEMIPPPGFEPADFVALCDRLFPATERGSTDWQRVAALAALVRPFVVISGGPGSGKTYTVARIISLLRYCCGNDMRVALAAPTGKAVSRLKESVAAQADLLAGAGLEIVTIHRLLGLRPGGGSRFGPDRPLPYDLVVVDEASMVDIVLMSQVVGAIADDCRLILLGDHRQLAAVEPGAVFAAFCGDDFINGFSAGFSDFVAGAGGGEVVPNGNSGGDGVIFLRHSHRFGSGGGIARLARAVADGDGREAVDIIATGGGGEITHLDPGGEFARVLGDFFKSRPGFTRPESLDEAFSWLERLRILCPARSGKRGVEEVNRILCSLAPKPGPGSLVPGQPVMIRRNDYQINLFNGDIGVVSPADDVGRIFFMDESAGRRSFSPSALPEWETVYAMTVHKSQGSEFAEVLLVLPAESGPIMSRELFYTAITRAREKVHIWGDPGVIREMVERPSALSPVLEARLAGCVESPSPKTG